MHGSRTGESAPAAEALLPAGAVAFGGDEGGEGGGIIPLPRGVQTPGEVLPAGAASSVKKSRIALSA